MFSDEGGVGTVSSTPRRRPRVRAFDAAFGRATDFFAGAFLDEAVLADVFRPAGFRAAAFLREAGVPADFAAFLPPALPVGARFAPGFRAAVFFFS
jgi:hypothetical protein